MKQKIDAIYENGLLRPLEPLDLANHERVSVTIERGAEGGWLDRGAVEWAGEHGNPCIALEEVRSRLTRLSGSLADLVTTERGEY